MSTMITANLSGYQNTTKAMHSHSNGLMQGKVQVSTQNTDKKELGVVSEISDEGLAALTNSKKESEMPRNYRELPKKLAAEYDWTRLLTDEEKAQLDEQHGTDPERIMKIADSKAYEKYQELNMKGQKSGKQEDIVDAWKYMVKWYNDTAKNDHSKLTQAINEYGKSSESKLSNRAFEYLKNLRKNYGDFDFIIADSGDDFKGLVKQSNKEFSVVFSSAELERMARDEKYAAEKMRRVQTVVHMTDRICQEFGYERAWGKDSNGESNGIISKMALSFDENGKMSIFAELEKSSAKQRERIDELREKRAEEKKDEKDKDASPVRRVEIYAESEDELFEKISGIDWGSIAEEH